MTGNPDADKYGCDIERLVEYLCDLYRDNPDYYDFDEELRRLVETIIANRADDYGG